MQWLTLNLALAMMVGLMPLSSGPGPGPGGYVVAHTGQSECYDNQGRVISPKPGEPFFGQDANSISSPMAFKDGGDGTVADLRTGLTWTKTPWRAPIGRLKPRPKRAEQAGIELPGVLGKVPQERVKGEGGDEVARVDRPGERKA